MVDYSNLTDEQLVGKYQAGDEDSIVEIITRYKRFVSIEASRGAIRHPQIDVQDFESKIGEALWEAIKKYNTASSNGKPFKYFLKMVIAKRTYDLVRSKLYKDGKDASGNKVRNIKKEQLKTVSLEGLTEKQNELGNEIKVEFEDKKASIEQAVEFEEQQTALYNFLLSKNERDAKIAILVAQGFVYSEIVKMLDLPNKMTITRALERCQKYAKEFLQEMK